MVALRGILLLLSTVRVFASRSLAEAELLDECGFHCQSSADCRPGLLCSLEHGPQLVERGFSPTTADCDFLPPDFTACFKASILTRRNRLRDDNGSIFSTTTTTSPPSRMAIALVDVVTAEELIVDITDGMTIYLPYGGRNFSIKATPLDWTSSVVFDWDGYNNYRTERYAPYFLFSENYSGQILTRPLTDGLHSVTATATSTGVTKTVDFTVKYDCARSIKPC